MISECPPWPQPDVRFLPYDAAIFLVVTAWERATYPERLARYRAMWQPRVWKDCTAQRYIDLPPVYPVAAWRRALQGVE